MLEETDETGATTEQLKSWRCHVVKLCYRSNSWPVHFRKSMSINSGVESQTGSVFLGDHVDLAPHLFHVLIIVGYIWCHVFMH